MLSAGVPLPNDPMVPVDLRSALWGFLPPLLGRRFADGGPYIVSDIGAPGEIRIAGGGLPATIMALAPGRDGR